MSHFQDKFQYQLMIFWFPQQLTNEKKMKLTEITTWQELISLSMPASIEQPNCSQLKISQKVA